MRRLRSTPGGGRLTLLLLMALLVTALPGAQPAAVAQSPAPAPASATLQTPLFSLPSDPIAPEPRYPRQVAPGAKGPGLPPGAVSFGAPTRAGLASLSSGCAALGSNGSFEASVADPSNPVDPIIYDWVEITRALNLDTSAYVSYPYGVYMSDRDELGDADELSAAPAFGWVRDQDWFGQDFFLPAETRSLLIDFSIQYPSTTDGDLGLDQIADQGYIELYEVDANGDLIDSDPNTAILDGAIIWRLDSVFEDDTEDPHNQWWRLINFANDEGNPDDFALLRGKRVAIVFSQLGDKLTPYEEPILDNVQVIACPQASEPDVAISGHVRRAGVPAEGATDPAISTASLALIYSPDGVNEELIRTVTPRTDGFYRFTALPDPGPAGYYQVLYLKSGFEAEADDPATTDDDRLAYYAGPRVTSAAIPPPAQGDLSRDVVDLDFEIADISLLDPPHLSEVAGEVTYSWTASPLAGARYIVCFFDPATEDEHCLAPTAATALTLSAAALDAAWPGFAYGLDLGWYVRVIGPGYNTAAPVFEDLGASGYSSYLKFFEAAASVPAPPPEESEAPPAAAGDESWTLMFYMAGDDEDLTNPPGYARSMQDMVPNLIGLADQYPNVNIVAQFDFFETDQSPVAASLRGTQYCYFKAGERNLGVLCQQLGELSMASPATLTQFIARTQSAYPADHTALIMLGHGSPVAGVAGDRTGADDAMEPTELDQALRAAGLNQAANKLDALVFYNCLMGSYEVTTLAAQYADYMVASPNIATLVDINPAIVALASANPANPRAFAAGIVAAYDDAMVDFNERFGNSVSVAMAAYDLSRLPAVTTEVNGLAQALIDNLTRPEVRAARDTVQQYDSSAPVLWGFNAGREDALVDLGNLATKLSASPNTAVSGAAARLLNALGAPGGAGSLVLATVARSGVADLRDGGSHGFEPAAATGLSIYFPNGSTQGGQAAMTRAYLLNYRQLGLGAGTWDELVDATRTGLPSLPRSIKLTGLGGTTLQNQSAPDLFPPVASMPGGSNVFLPLIKR